MDVESKDCCCEKKLPKANELPIYKSLEDTYEYEVAKRAPLPLEQGISYVRRNLAGPFESLQNVKGQVESVYETAFTHTKTGYDYITDDANMIPRAAAITVGGLSGLLLGARGGIFRKVFYSGTGMAIVASICYPKQVFDYSKCGYQWTIAKTTTVIKDTTGYDLKNTTWNIADILPFDKISDILPFDKIKGIFTTKKIEGDPGQSNPADKDLYTTRSE